MTARRMLKVQLHTHTADDPQDRIAHSTKDLIDLAGREGFDALAVTLHDRQLDIAPLRDYAAERGLVLIPGIERTIEGRHVLLLNFPRETEHVRTFDDLAGLKARGGGAVIAPHPFFPWPSALRGALDAHAGLFDAVERNGAYTAAVDFNRRAELWAALHGKPVVGGGDVHRLPQLGTTYSLVDAEPNADAICAAIVAGRVRAESRPLSWLEAAALVATLALVSIPRPAPAGVAQPDSSPTF